MGRPFGAATTMRRHGLEARLARVEAENAALRERNRRLRRQVVVAKQERERFGPEWPESKVWWWLRYYERECEAMREHLNQLVVERGYL